MMKLKNLYILLLALLPTIGLWSCEKGVPEEENAPLKEGTPVVFTFDDPSGFGNTRGVESYKRLFVPGDVIHVQAEFEVSEGGTKTAYGAMRLNEARKWEPVEGSELYWPFDAVKGDFKAYHIYGSDGLLYPGSTTPPVSLSVITDTQDPLEAVKADVKYGNAVNMQFTHACTHLTLEKLDLNVTDYYWMVFSGEGKKIQNAFCLSLDDDNRLSLDFVSVEDSDYKNAVYISRRSETMTVEERVENGDGDGESETITKTYSKTAFYLAPGMYDSFELRTNNNFPYMSFNNSIPGDETGRKPGQLLANHPYILNVEFAKGADYVTSTDEEWDENNAPFAVDVKDFLEAVSNGREFTAKAENGEEVPILRAVNGSLVLLRNLDFNFFKDYRGKDEWGFDPDVSAGIVFEGNLHYIENIGHPIFRGNSGVIQNLGLKNLQCDLTAWESNNKDEDFSNIGGLCLLNNQGAIINNIRMEDFDLTVKIKAEDPQETSSNENFSIGGLCGDNLGTISEISLKGGINITVEPLGVTDTDGDKYSYVDANVYIGGIAGNHTMILTDVGPERGATDTSVTITNTCRGRDEWGSGVFCVGGAVGQSTAKEISHVEMRNVTINAKESDGYQQYIGGLAGRLRGDQNASPTYRVSSCMVDGTLTCGTVSQYGDKAINPYSYVGGISGNARHYDIDNCRAVCGIDAQNVTSPGATYATGGAIGRIQAGVSLSYNHAVSTPLYGPQAGDGDGITAYVGSFAGIAETAYTEEGLTESGNTAQNSGYSMIGGSIDDDPNM